MQNSSGIENKVVVITGASSGIGEATALLLAERGAKVVLGAPGSDRLQALAARISDGGGEAAYAPTDVRRRDDLSNLVKLACERYGKLDVLVNNAGTMPVSPLDDLCVEDWEDMIDINIKGVMYGIAAALAVFRKQPARDELPCGQREQIEADLLAENRIHSATSRACRVPIKRERRPLHHVAGPGHDGDEKGDHETEEVQNARNWQLQQLAADDDPVVFRQIGLASPPQCQEPSV
jgi:NAD(P)-dependent dehydrogenase (short-subunit alcohol dehydrogenase family)